jgi:Glycosyl transferase family 2
VRTRLSGVVAGLAAANFVNAAMGFITGPLLARALGPTGRGDLAAVTVPLTLAPAVLGLGVPAFAYRQLPRGRPIEQVIGSLGLPLLVIGLFAAAGAIPVADALAGGRETVRTCLIVVMLLMPLFLLGSLLLASLAALERWRRVVAGNAIPFVVPFVAIVVLDASGHLTVATAAAATIAGSLLSLVPGLPLLTNRRPVFRPSIARNGMWSELRCVRIPRTGLVAALNGGLAAACGAIVAFVDDDAVPTVDWLERIVETFKRDERIAAVGGRDVIFEGGRILGLVPRRRSQRLLGEPGVGRIRWFGRMLGNHHVGVGAARDIDVLKGTNMSYRRQAVFGRGFDERLRGEGVQMHSELSICLPLRRRGLRVVYDPAISVMHYPARRALGSQRDEGGREALASSAHNETLQIGDYFGPLRRLIFMV